MLIDLQLHSTYSDGYLTPSEAVKFVAGKGVKIAALTDHNTVAGTDEFKKACQALGIKPIVGLELYVTLNRKRFNILWYNFDETAPELHKILRNTQIRRRGRARVILEQLKKNGFSINTNKILDKYTHYTPINHMVDDIWSVPVNRKKIKNILKNKNPREGDIIAEFFYNKKIGKLHETYISIERIIKLRKKIGGQIILNHPAKYQKLDKEFLKKIKKLGVDGIEKLSPHHSVGAVMFIQYLCREIGFIETGGSDFHRFEGNKYLAQSSYDYFEIDSKYLKGVGKVIG
jgi:predicted metal-dependent phosphoesterase TrpH